MYIENPRNILPGKLACLNDPAHMPYWNSSWERGLCLDYINATQITMCNAYCEMCQPLVTGRNSYCRTSGNRWKPMKTWWLKTFKELVLRRVLPGLAMTQERCPDR